MQALFASRFDAPVDALFGFHERPEALERLIPPWESMRVVVPPKSLEVGTQVVVEVRLGPIPIRARAEHVAYRRGVEFADRLHAPGLHHWLHRHRFFSDGEGSVLLDAVEWSVGFAPIDRLADALFVGARLRRMFEHRHTETARALGCSVRRLAGDDALAWSAR